ncbi:MAG: UDP-N-acetylglucosamine 1-carboxyvinyltransferase [Holosporaceae bacterium]|nr:UDP-N-acetylglucosamine 1-carboxyvinyltransferase [Holosporaceae bacterium]
MIEKLKVYGNQKVNGTVNISGAKNAALPILAAGLLSENGLQLSNVPPLADVSTMLSLLERLGVSYTPTRDAIHAMSVCLKTDSVDNFIAPYEIVKKMRASILVLGPLLTRFGQCAVSMPGGCTIGVRPIDFHIKGMEALGARVELKDGYVHAVARKGLKGTVFKFPVISVTGTENLMMAATLADGTTVLQNVAKEPEVVDLANCLNKMGAKISGAGTDVITITGVASLHSVKHSIISDRIEAGSYAIAAGITSGCVNLIGENLRYMLSAFIEKMSQIGLIFSDIPDGISVKCVGKLEPIDIETAEFPGYPTDLQAQSMSLLCLADGVSNIRENIWENRFQHVAELSRMGANISYSASHAIVTGIPKFTSAPVMATDLRASFGLVLAALAAAGDSMIDRAYHLDRGYCCIEEKFSKCGVLVERIR